VHALLRALFVVLSTFAWRSDYGVIGPRSRERTERTTSMKIKHILLVALTALTLGLASFGMAAPAHAASKGGAAGDVIRR
jgi:hypothetical protein